VFLQSSTQVNYSQHHICSIFTTPRWWILIHIHTYTQTTALHLVNSGRKVETNQSSEHYEEVYLPRRQHDTITDI